MDIIALQYVARGRLSQTEKRDHKWYWAPDKLARRRSRFAAERIKGCHAEPW